MKVAKFQKKKFQKLTVNLYLFRSIKTRNLLISIILNHPVYLFKIYFKNWT